MSQVSYNAGIPKVNEREDQHRSAVSLALEQISLRETAGVSNCKGLPSLKEWRRLERSLSAPATSAEPSPTDSPSGR